MFRGALLRIISDNSRLTGSVAPSAANRRRAPRLHCLAQRPNNTSKEKPSSGQFSWAEGGRKAKRAGAVAGGSEKRKGQGKGGGGGREVGKGGERVQGEGDDHYGQGEDKAQGKAKGKGEQDIGGKGQSEVAWVRPLDLAEELFDATSAKEVLQRCEQLWTPWTRAGCPSQAGNNVPNVPEAAFMLRRLATSGASCSRAERSSLSREPFVRGLIRHIVASACHCSSADERCQAVANTVWSLAVLAGPFLYAEEMAAIVEEPCNFERGIFRPSQVADLCWGLAICQHEPTRLESFVEVIATTEGGLRAYNQKDITTVLWALATLRPPPSAMVTLLRSTPLTWGGSGRQADVSWAPLDLSTDQLSTCAWALAVMGAAEAPQLLRMWQDICERSDSFLKATNTRFSLLRIHQVALTLEMESSYDPRALHGDGRKVMAAARRAWNRDSGNVRSKHVSHLQREIGTALATLGLNALEESNVAGYSVDLTVPEYGLAIEADGPSHFSRTTGRLLGPTVLKRRHLRKAGWAVLSVPLPMWEELIGPDERLRYLKAELEKLKPWHEWSWSSQT